MLFVDHADQQGGCNQHHPEPATWDVLTVAMWLYWQILCWLHLTQPVPAPGSAGLLQCHPYGCRYPGMLFVITRVAWCLSSLWQLPLLLQLCEYSNYFLMTTFPLCPCWFICSHNPLHFLNDLINCSHTPWSLCFLLLFYLWFAHLWSPVMVTLFILKLY